MLLSTTASEFQAVLEIGKHSAPAGCFGFKLLFDQKANVKFGLGGEEREPLAPLHLETVPEDIILRGFSPGDRSAGL